MNRLDAINVKLQKNEIVILKKYYIKGKLEARQHFFWEKIDDSLAPDYTTLKALDALGFVKLELENNSRGTVYDSYFLTLYSSAIYRAEFESSNEITKFFVKQSLRYKDWMASIGFVLSVFLFILRIVEYIQKQSIP